MSRIEQLISEIEEYIDGCKAQPFTNNKKIIVDKDEMEELLVELRLRTPDEIKKYQKIISNKDAITGSAKEEADKIINEAKAQAEQILADAREQAGQIIAETEQHSADLVSEHEVMQQAYQQAGEIMDQANESAQQLVDSAAADSDNIREGAIRYTDEMLASLQTIINHTMSETAEKFNALMESLQSHYDIVTNNRSELELPGEEAAASTEPEQKKEKPAEDVLNTDMLG